MPWVGSTTRAIPLVLEHLSHPDARVRRGVRRALSGHDDEAAILGLIALSRDEEAVVRDWATFSLAQDTTADTPPIREALNARLSDPDSGARFEAMMGLARREDPRAIPAVVEALTLGRFAGLVLEAAAEIASPALCPALLMARDHGMEWQQAGMAVPFWDDWQAASVACGCIGLESNDFAVLETPARSGPAVRSANTPTPPRRRSRCARRRPPRPAP
jgi:HEAT repeats